MTAFRAQPDAIRRQLNQGLLAGVLGWGSGLARAGTPVPDSVRPDRELRFPRDHGAHLASRTEWWYVTGRLWDAGGRIWGFQVTFFRHRTGWQPPQSPGLVQPMGRFDPVHLLVAHAAVSDVQGERLLHDQRLSRWNGQSLVRDSALEDDTGLRVQGCEMVRQPDGRYGITWRPRVSRSLQDVEASLSLDLRLQPTQPVLLQGERGYSRKGPEVGQASHYYTQPQLSVAGTVGGEAAPGGQDVTRVAGTAWLDHEWSDTLMHPDAVGWDWIGMNLNEGHALTAFRLRRADGSTLWAGGSWRSPDDRVAHNWRPTEVRFEPLREWRSPASGARYPVGWRVTTPKGAFQVQAVMDAQEIDARRSTGTWYWEGLSRLELEATGREVGWGYLEMTGYAGRLRL